MNEHTAFCSLKTKREYTLTSIADHTTKHGQWQFINSGQEVARYARRRYTLENVVKVFLFMGF